MDHSRALRWSLLANAAFSASSGTAMLVFYDRLGGWLGPDLPLLYLVLGAGLLTFAMALAAMSRMPRPILVVGVLVADFSWIVGTSVAVVLAWSSFAPLGVAAVVLTNAVVAGMIAAQARGLGKFYALDGAGDWYEVCVKVPTSTNASLLWPVVADLGGIAQHMSTLVSSTLEGGAAAGEGAVRTCESVRGQRWSERCTRWTQGESFDVRFASEAPDFPFPFEEMVGGWRLNRRDGGCDVEVWWRMRPRRRRFIGVLLAIMAFDAARTFSHVVASMVAKAEGHAPGRVRPRLSAAYC